MLPHVSSRKTSPDFGPNPGNGSTVSKIRLGAAWILCLSYFYMIPLEFSALQWHKSNNGLWQVTEGTSPGSWFMIQYVLWMGITFLGVLLFLGTSLGEKFGYERNRRNETLRPRDLAYYFAWSQVLSLGFFILYDLLPGEMGGGLSTLLPYLPHLLMMALAFVLFRRCLGQVGFCGLPARHWLAMMFAVGVGYLFVYFLLDPLVTEPVARFFSLEIQSWREHSITDGINRAVSHGWIYAGGQLLLIGVIGPIAEEITFRGVLQGVLLPKVGKVASVLFSSTLFALFHVDVVFFAPLFVMGLILGTLYILFRSLWAPILFHILNNVVSVILDLVS
ncbi:CPBP family intramembrane glutamic endopeptidase [Melghirimyces algeriensis]|uniref:CAAX prenyl protease 2/Lysostaphin resistance protein A-like domain-containing protein n=1 Tax=Melghirimyces algeriensis TaxID=910412 RepID=A0A521FBD7_9BACL|nr:CPBP family intramembrane glutamic endopeptidase [Melghirimyces algeriensis]SMO93463.1 hypothetical protein SAMN06264849_1162 [Melghirimyces algeriensis]